MPLLGLDISAHQQSTPALGGLDFVVVRAAYGNQYDPLYNMHAANVRAAGKILIAYQFGRDQSPASQVDALLSIASGADGWALDVEADTGHPTSINNSQAAAWVAAMHAAGLKVGIYASELRPYPDLGQDWRWVANWTREPAIPWDLWQYASPPDRDQYRGTPAELLALLGASVASGAGAGSTGSPAEVTPAEAWSPLYVAASRLADIIGATRPNPWWAASQGLTAGHFGAPPEHADAVDYLAKFLYGIAQTAKSLWSGGNPEAVIAQPAFVPSGTSDPTTLTAPVYVGAVDVANATSSFIPLPPWYATQSLTPLHLGDPPTIQDGADYVLDIANSVLSSIGGAPVPILPPAPGTENPPPPPSAGSGAGAGSTGKYDPGAPITPGKPPAGGKAYTGPPFITGPRQTGTAGTQKVWADFGQLVNHTLPQLGASMVAAARRAAGR